MKKLIITAVIAFAAGVGTGVLVKGLLNRKKANNDCNEESINDDCGELIRILTSIIKKIKDNPQGK